MSEAAEPVQLIYSDSPGSLPADYVIPPGLELVISSVFARFDGSGASGQFLACLSVLSSDGKLIGRFFPSQRLSAGDTGAVTYAPF